MSKWFWTLGVGLKELRQMLPSLQQKAYRSKRLQRKEQYQLMICLVDPVIQSLTGLE
jgi:hypothetical protein